ncbi:hypothetical protein BYT27DRAFT_7343435 [Phlegmacium glaucopus]|nr:hypothetical protein BYT27DRAFT_7343435 [Phlegmacium glaucopus]
MTYRSSWLYWVIGSETYIPFEEKCKEQLRANPFNACGVGHIHFVRYLNHLYQSNKNTFILIMATMLKDFILASPNVSLSHARYGHDFQFGNSMCLFSSPMQHFRFAVELEGSENCFIVLGQLAGFKIVEDSFGLCLSLDLGQIGSLCFFAGLFQAQLETLESVEEQDATDCAVKDQHIKWRSSNNQLNLKAYGRQNIANCSLSLSDVGSSIVAVVKLCCLDVSCGPSTYSRTYWIEMHSVYPFTANELIDSEHVQDIIRHWWMMKEFINSDI